MKPKRIIRPLVPVLLALAGALTGFGSAQAAYPSKPIELVAPYGPGGASDLAARTLASVAPQYIGQPVLVVNRTGAGGVVGSNFVRNARPDGYTLLIARVGSEAVGPALNPTIPYKYNDFTFLGLLELNPYVFVVKADSPYKTFGDLVKALKEHPGKLSYSTSGPGTILNMGPQMLFDILGLPTNAATMVPYKGGGGAATALLGGHVDFLGVNLATVLSNIQAGKLRALAVTTPERYAGLPNVPTVKELGYPKLEGIVGWSGLWGPPGLPKDVVRKWVKALQKISKDKTWNGLEKKLGSVPYIQSPEKTKAFVDQQYKVYHSLGKKLGLIVH
ncbi:MAG: tripartite tricarboxylate transporter substrate binding protein [Gammaproteobacteria bacterium]